MRQYYYLTDLMQSPYALSLPDALHLGALGSLNLYAYLDEPLTAIYGDFLDVSEHGVFAILPRLTVATMEKAYMRDMDEAHSNVYTLTHAWFDTRRHGPGSTMPDSFLMPPEEARLEGAPHLVNVMHPHHRLPSVRIAELLCFSEDLEYLADADEELASEPVPGNSESLDPRRETTHLRLIRALLAEAGIDTSKDYPAARAIQEKAALHGIPVPHDEKTIVSVLKAIKSQL